MVALSVYLYIFSRKDFEVINLQGRTEDEQALCILQQKKIKEQQVYIYIYTVYTYTYLRVHFTPLVLNDLTSP